jgi:hypothetical protein
VYFNFGFGRIPAPPTLKVLISLRTQVTDNQPVLNKELTPKAIAVDCFYLRGDLGSTPGAEECPGEIVCQCVILKGRAMFTDTLLFVLFGIFHVVRIRHGRFHWW